MTTEFSYNRLGALPMTPFAGAPLCTSPRVNAAPAGYVWFFDLLTKELHHTKLSDWQISLVVIGLERMIPPDDFVNMEIEAKAAVIAKLQQLKEQYPASDAIQAITAGLLDLISRTHIDPAPVTLEVDPQELSQLDETGPAEEGHVEADSEAPGHREDSLSYALEAEEAQADAEASQEVVETAPGPKRKKKGKHA